MTAMGRALITGDGVRVTLESLRYGAALLRDAMQKGDAQAPEVLASMAAFGILRPRDGVAARQLLETSAQRGWASAQRQLEVLETAPQGTGHTRLLHERPRLRVLENFATAAECDWLIDRTRDHLERAEVYHASSQVEVHDVRTNSEAYLTPKLLDVVTATVLLRIAAAAGVDLALCEFATVLHYLPGQLFGPHADYLDPNNPARLAELRASGQRVATFLVYLSDDYEDGETEFLDVGVKYKGRKGDALMFLNVEPNGEPDYSSRHQGSAPSRGEKWVLSQWVRNRALNPYLTPGGESARLPETWLQDAWRA